MSGRRTSSRRITVGADKAYDTKSFIAGTRALNVTAHVQKNDKGRRSNLDRRTTRHAGYAISLSRRWLVEKTFGWLKQTGPTATRSSFEGWQRWTGSSSSVAPPTTCSGCHGSSQANSSKTCSSTAPKTG